MLIHAERDIYIGGNYMNIEARRAQKREYMRKYTKSKHGKAVRAKYTQSDEYKASRAGYAKHMGATI